MVRSPMWGAVWALALLGCNELAGIKDPIGVSPDSFVGTWTSTDSTIALSDCATSGTGSLGPVTLVITKGTTTALNIIVGGGCNLDTTVDGATASLLADQGCEFPGTATADPQTQLYGVSTFQLLSDSTPRASARITGGIRFKPVGSAPTDCLFEQVGTYTRQ